MIYFLYYSHAGEDKISIRFQTINILLKLTKTMSTSSELAQLTALTRFFLESYGGFKTNKKLNLQMKN